MHIIRLVGAALAALVALLLIAGALLPREHRATSAITVRAPREAAWDAIRDLSRVPEWWPEVKSARRLPDTDRQETWEETLGDGSVMTLANAEERPPEQLVRRIISKPGDPFGGRWIYEVTGGPAGTTITVTEDGWVANPLFRVISRLAGHHRTLDSYLIALGRKLGEPVKPIHRS
jgi:polyketide cyclase/dehydrase/lipid transport protein